MEHDFQFLTKEDAKQRNEASGEAHWFRVGEVLTLEEGPGIFTYIQDAGLAAHKRAFHELSRLHTVAHRDLVINYFEEESQDLDKVLNIFIRVNSGGTVLSYSDLLLSIAAAQWEELDAREAVYGLLDDLNDTGQGFAFSKDLVLKSGLVLGDIPTIGFSVTNFNAANMQALEQRWVAISSALRLAVRLLADFGFSAKTLSADSVVIPIAYYLHRATAAENFLTAQRYATDREAIRLWAVRSLLKRGIWGSGLDTLLGHLRLTIKEHSGSGFPVSELESVMAQRGKSLRFSQEELGELLGVTYGDKSILPALSLLYPGMNFRHEFHVDHIFPRARYTRKRLASEGVPAADIETYVDDVNALPNLQLLEGPMNVEKQARLPLDWMESHFPDQGARNEYLVRHDLTELTDSVTGFGTFFSMRRDRIRSRLVKLLQIET